MPGVSLVIYFFAWTSFIEGEERALNKVCLKHTTMSTEHLQVDRAEHMKDKGLALSETACPLSFFCGAVTGIFKISGPLEEDRNFYSFKRGYGDSLPIIFVFGLVLLVARQELRCEDCPKLPICHLNTCKGTSGVKEREWTSVKWSGLSLLFLLRSI